MRITECRLLLREGQPYLTSQVKLFSAADKLTCPETIAQLCRDFLHMHELAEEYLYLIGTDSKGKHVTIHEISHGTVNYAVLQPREIMIRALLSGASQMFIVHNHPSEDCMPSKEDYDTTKRMAEICKLMGIPLVDHVIIGGYNHYSFAENKQL